MLAYIDSFAGLVPCKVIKTAGDQAGNVQLVAVQVTSKRFERSGYEFGSKHEFQVTRVIPRDAVRRRKYSTTIMPYTWYGRTVA